MVERQLVELNVAGSNPVDHPKGTYSLTDKALVFGTSNRGSIPLRCARARSSVVEQETLNFKVVGPTPTALTFDI